MWLELPLIFTHLSTCPHTRAIILSGAGPRAFTTGLDVAAASTTSVLAPNHFSSPSSPTPTSQTEPATPLDPARIATHLRHHITTFQSCISALATSSKPLLCALHGYAYGLALDIALCADVRICTAGTRFSVKEVDIGIAADVGTLSRLGKCVGSGSWVRDVCLTGREFGGGEAWERGLVSWLGGGEGGGGSGGGGGGSGGGGGGKVGGGGDTGKEAMMKEAMRWGRVVSEKSPVAVQGTKEILEWSRDRSVEDGLRYTAVWNAAMLQTGDVARAMQAGMERGKATFEKL
jgi:delta(3,5)-delta(2,4)-dienoyl-CoA isomerase